MGALSKNVERQWYSKPSWLLLFAPLSALFVVISFLRRKYFAVFQKPKGLSAPVIVVGNIAVGGTGKTPLIISLVLKLAELGYKPGVIARGYGAEVEGSVVVSSQSTAIDVGDEPLLIFQSCHCPVAVGKNRIESAQLLIDREKCDLILSDDGLQHYALHRDVEVAVIDSRRLLGNGWRLPVGPLRESRNRLSEVDFVFCNGEVVSESWLPQSNTFAGSLEPVHWVNVKTSETIALNDLPLDGAVAVAGIGNPHRFFSTLKDLGFAGPTKGFADHHGFSSADFKEITEPVLMTEKDAVKCSAFAEDNWWALSVGFQLPSDFVTSICKKLEGRDK